MVEGFESRTSQLFVEATSSCVICVRAGFPQCPRLCETSSHRVLEDNGAPAFVDMTVDESGATELGPSELGTVLRTPI